MSIYETAKEYEKLGIRVIPFDVQKDSCKPHSIKWRNESYEGVEHHKELFLDSNGMGIVCGKVSGNIQVIDVDQKHDSKQTLSSRFLEALRYMLPNLWDSFYIEETRSGGLHIIFKREGVVDKKIFPAKTIETKDGKVSEAALIEILGDGQLVFVAPSKGYTTKQGSLEELPTITNSEFNELLDVCESFNELPEKDYSYDEIKMQNDGDSRPGADFNRQCDPHRFAQFLVKHDWKIYKKLDDKYWLTRPGKDEGVSATWNHDGRRQLVVFSSNTDFVTHRDDGHQAGHSAFSIYAKLECNGNFKAAAAKLSRKGFGEKSNEKISPIPLGKLIQKIKGYRKPIIEGLFREGETMNIIAAPKTGKSWLVMNLGITISMGGTWLNKYQTIENKVLLVDNELHEDTLSSRFQTMLNAMKITDTDLNNNFDVTCLRGKLTDLNSICKFLKEKDFGAYKVVIIDAWYRALPSDTNENDNGQIMVLYNLLDEAAAKSGCSFILIHHTSKGDQSGKSITDVGAGAGSQSRAADTHLILRKHKDENAIVLDAVTRSWEPTQPICLQKEFPLFITDPELDPKDLQGISSRGKKEQSTHSKKIENSKNVTAYDFVEKYIKDKPIIKDKIIDNALKDDISEKTSIRLIKVALDDQLIFAWSATGNNKAYSTTPPPSGTKSKKKVVIEALKKYPDKSSKDIAELSGATKKYVNTIKKELKNEK